MIYWILFGLLIAMLVVFVYLPDIIGKIKFYKYKKNQVKITDYHNNDEDDGYPKGVL
jgi:hypothetical protein